jgi:hypothetical protein
VSQPDTTLTIAAADLGALNPADEAFVDSVRAVAEALATLEPRAICLQSSPSTAVIRAILAAVIRRQNALLRTSTCLMRAGDPASGHLAVIYRRTTMVASVSEHEGVRTALSVAVAEPPYLLANAVAGPLTLPGEGGPVLAAGPAQLAGLPGSTTLHDGSDGTLAIHGRGASLVEAGTQRTEGHHPVAISWARVELQ